MAVIKAFLIDLSNSIMKNGGHKIGELVEKFFGKRAHERRSCDRSNARTIIKAFFTNLFESFMKNYRRK
jgi:hypothetical protein